MEPRYLVVPINKDSVKDSFVAISNVMSDDWICVCKLNSGEKRCKTCENLSSKGNVIPPLDSGRKVLHIRLSDYKAMTHIVLIVPKSHDKVEVMGDLYTRSERHLSYRLPTFSDMLLTYPESVTKGTSVLTLYNDTLYYNLTLLGMDTVLKAFHIQLQPQKCSSKTDLHDGNMMSLHIPWSNEDVYSFNKLGEVGNLTVKLQNGISQEHKDDTIHMRVYIDPACTYLLRIMVSPLQILGQLIRFYAPLLPGYLVAVVMMGLMYQLRRMGKEGFCPSLLESIGINGPPYRVVPLVMVISFALNFASLSTTSIFRTDVQKLQDKGLLSPQLMPLILYSITLGIANFHCFILDMGIKAISRIFGLLFSCCSDALPILAYKTQIPLFLVAAILSAVICGPLGLLICYSICIIKVIRTCHISLVRRDEDSKSRYCFYFTICLLLMPTVAFNLPTLVMWAKQFMIVHRLENDPSAIVSVCCVLATMAIFVCDSPLTISTYYMYFCWVVQISTVITLLYSTILLYRIPYITVAMLTGLAVPQVYNKVQVMTGTNKKFL